MDFKKFSYSYKDVDMLKKEMFFRIFFACLFSIILVWQIVLLAMNAITNSISIPYAVASIVVILTSLCFISICIMYTVKAKSTINTINANGRCVSKVQVLKSLEKTGFIKLYSLLCKIFALLTSLVVAVAVTYLILQSAFEQQISFFYPLLFLCCTLAYNTVFHILNEIKTMQLVDEYNSLY